MAENSKGKKISKTHPKHPLMLGFSIFILIVIVVAFVGAPLITNLSSSERLVFGSYDGKDINFYPGNYLSRQKDAIATRVADSGTDTNVQWVAYQVWKAAFEQTVVHTALLDDAKESGFDVSDEKIDEALATYGPYIRDGKFDPELYKQVSSREKMETRRLFREDLIHSQIISDLQYGQRFSSQEISLIKDMAKEKKSFRITAITPDSFPSEKVIEYGKSNEQNFHQASFSRITIKSSLDAAENVLDKLKEAPSTFEETAKTQSKDAYAERGGKVGAQYYYSFKGEFENEEDAAAVFALNKDQLSEVMTTPFGWVIYKCDSESSAPDWSSDEVLTTVRAYMERFERGAIEDYLITLGNSLRESALASGFEAASDTAGYTRFDTEEFGINYGNIELFPPVTEDEAGILNGAASDEEFFRTLFPLTEGEISAPILVGENVIIAKELSQSLTDDESLGIIDFYYPLIVQQYQEEELQRSILQSDLLVNNFDAIFSQYFLN